METLLYLVKVNFYWILFYACYWLLLRKHTFFQWNRFYLTGSLLAAFMLPAIRLAEPVRLTGVSSAIYQKATISVSVVASQAPETGIPMGWFVAAIYGCITLFLFGKLIRGLYRLHRAIRTSECIEMDGYTLVFLPENERDQDISSFSFFRWLFLGAFDYRHNLDTVLQHELVHIRQRHTIDILIVECIKTVFWINPVLWLYKRSIETVHEYLADQPVAHRGNYASFLVSYALRSPDISLANHFFNSSLLKNRIRMIYKKRSSRWTLTRYLLILPVMAVSVLITASKAPLQSITSIHTEKAFNLNVKGNVTDEKHAPVADAIVVIAGTTRGATTDGNGWFELKDVPENAKLVITHVAYETQEIVLDKTVSELMITLKKAANKINGPMVTGETMMQEGVVIPNTTKASGDNMKIMEQQPEFPGGRDALMLYLRENLKYPEVARKANVEAIALVSFTVDKSGTIRNAKSLKNIGFGIDKEALRVVNEMPEWNPAIQNGRAIEMEYTLEINFKIDQDKRQGFLDFNTNGMSTIPSIEEIGTFLNGTVNLSASGKAPEVIYWGAVGSMLSANPVNEYVQSQKGKYRYLKDGYGFTAKKYVWQRGVTTVRK